MAVELPRIERTDIKGTWQIPRVEPLKTLQECLDRIASFLGGVVLLMVIQWSSRALLPVMMYTIKGFLATMMWYAQGW